MAFKLYIMELSSLPMKKGVVDIVNKNKRCAVLFLNLCATARDQLYIGVLLRTVGHYPVLLFIECSTCSRSILSRCFYHGSHHTQLYLGNALFLSISDSKCKPRQS